MSLQFPYEDRVLGSLLAKNAAKYSDRIFLTTDDASYTFAEAFTRSQAIAKGLRKIGVQAGTPVMIMLDNCAEFVFSWFAIALLDAVCVPANTAYTGDLLAYVISDSAAEVAITTTKVARVYQDLPQGRRAKLAKIVLCGEGDISTTGFEVTKWSELERTIGPDIVSQGKPSDIAILTYTSGTTGPSKGVLQTNAMPFQTMETFVNAVGVKETDVLFAPLPMFHGMSRTMASLSALTLGARVHLASRFSATTFWEDVKRAGATISITIFTIPPILKKRAPSPLDKTHGLKVMFNAHHDTEFEERFGVQIVEAFGMTEIGLALYSPFPERKYGASGKPGPAWEAKLVDDEERPVATGSAGQLLLRPRSPGVMMEGYLNKPEVTLKALKNLWFHTGDLMRQDEEGYYFYAGRMKERIRRRGENISAYEVETVACKHSALLECAAVGVPAGDNEDDLYLVAVMREEHSGTQADLFAWLSQNLPKFMVPRFIEFRKELPKTGSNKVELHTLLKTVPAVNAWDSLAGTSVKVPKRSRSSAAESA